MFRAPDWARCTDLQLLQRPIDAVERELRTATAMAAAIEAAAYPGDETVEATGDGLVFTNRLGKDSAHMIARLLGYGRDRLVDAAKRLIEPENEIATKPSRKRCPGHLIEIADAAQTKARKTGCHASAEPQRRRRQKGQGRARTVPGNNRAVHAIASDSPGRTRRIRQRGPYTKAQPLEPDDEIVQHGLFAAKQMSAAGRIEPHPIEPVHRGPGRIAPTPADGPLQQGCIRQRIGRYGLD